MFELFRPFNSSARDERRKTIEESRSRLEVEFRKPIGQMADMVWEAYDDFSRRARWFSAKILATSLAAILVLTLFFARTPYSIPYLGYEYITSYKGLFFSSVIFGAIGISIAIALMARKFGELTNIIRLKLPNLYRLDQRLAEDVAKDAVLIAVKREYDQQMRHAQDFVTKVRLARLEREELRTRIATFRANAWKEIKSVEDAEQVLRQQIFLASCTVSRGPVKWSAVFLDCHDPFPGTFDGMGHTKSATFGARFALFLETQCQTCGRSLRCDEPYQLGHNPVGELFGPDALSLEVPPLGTYKSWPVQDQGFDMFEGGWFCAKCRDAPKEPTK